jgi:protein TonB
MSALSATLLCLCVLLSGQSGAARKENRGQSEQQAEGQSEQPECEGPVYRQNEVTVRPHIEYKPEPGYTEEARRHRVSGRVLVEAVLCRTGKVADVEVIRGLPHGLSEQAVKAARSIRFEPGQKDGETVSVRIRLMYGFQLF